jgi:sulfate adenylyltransferase subunit 1 (EFTu-like GTPase family)
VQTVIRPQDDQAPDFRGLAGQVASGIFRPGDDIVHLPTGFGSRIKAIHSPAGMVSEAFPPMSVVIELDRDLDVSRGDMLARPNNLPNNSQDIEVMLCWFANGQLDPARRLLLLHTTRETKCLIREIRYKLDISTLHRSPASGSVGMNDLARVSLHCQTPLFWDSYKKNRQTGSIVLLDESTHATVAAGMIL